ncbi:MAG: protein O-GlcNAcase [Actinobacteria bacterium]|nr:protein O-GlcNAcase [Actinomycetota bacterium]
MSHHQAMIAAFETRHAKRIGVHKLEIKVTSDPSLAKESFHLRANKEATKVSAEITFATDPGLRWALNAFLKWLESDQRTIDFTDAPAFGVRGVIEGFYGNPWTHQQRLKGIESFADFGMNSYMMAPKDSPWQRFDWRKPFDQPLLDSTAELVERGNLHGVGISVCVSPGLSVKYSDDADVEAIMIRYRQLAAIGVKHFGLLFDDIPWELQFDEDIAQYATTAKAQASFTNRVYAALKAIQPDARLTVCPMEYCGRGPQPYIAELGNSLNTEIDLMWTGRQICSAYLDISDAIVFQSDAKRPPLYWDNYPVNDVAMTHELHVGPYQGREVGLENHSSGLFSNPMEHFEITLLPLATIGDYLWNSHTYDPRTSWDRALALMVTPENDYAAIRRLLKNSWGSCLNGNAAPDLGAIMGPAVTAWRSGKPEQAAEIFRKAAEVIIRDHIHLTSPQFSRPDLIAEITPWLSKYRAGGETFEKLSMVLSQCSWSKETGLKGPKGLTVEVLTIRTAFEQIQTRLFGDGLDLMMGELFAELKASENL